MKKVLAIALAAVLAVMFLAACGDASSSSSQATDPGSSSSQAASTSEPAGPTYGGNDISEEVTLRYLMVAPQKAPDHDMVWDVINARAKELINATVNVEIMLMSDHEERYGLELAAGEPYDVVFTGSWMHYASEAPAGAFQEITLDMVHQYMPQTTEKQKDLVSQMNQNLVDGKCYLIPQALTNVTVNANALGYREDLRVANGSAEITDLASLEAYYDDIIANNPGIFPVAAAANNNDLKSILFMTPSNKIPVGGTDLGMFFTYDWAPGMTPTDAANAIEFVGYQDDYKEWATTMKRWLDKGYWSRSAAADQTQTRDYFENGTAASYAQNTGTVGLAINTLKQNGFDTKGIDLYPNATRFYGASLDGLAVPHNSQNVERALMFMDILKYDEVCYESFRFGLEGTHWEWVDEEARIWKRVGNNADEANQGYQYGQGSWGFGSPEFEPRNMEGANPDMSIMFLGWRENAAENPIAPIAIDTLPIESELAELIAIRDEYMYPIDLGLVDDVDAAIAEFTTACEEAGIERVIEYIREQIANYVAAQ